MGFYLNIKTGQKIVSDKKDNLPSVDDLKKFASNFNCSEWLILASNREFRDCLMTDLKKTKLLSDKLIPKKSKSITNSSQKLLV
jgi:hypothetical protein